MIASLKKLRGLLHDSDLWKLARLSAAVFVMVLLEAAGICSILPFMRVATNPDIVDSNEWLRWIESLFAFRSREQMLVWLGVAALALYTASAVVNVFTNWLMHKTTWGIAHRISMRMLRRYTQLPYEFFLSHNSSQIVKKAIADIQILVTGVLMAGSQCLANLFKSFIILLLLFFVSPASALVACVVYGGGYLLIHASRHQKLERLGRDRQEAIYVRLKTFAEVLGGIKTLRVSGASATFVKRFEGASQRFAEIQPAFQLYSLVPRHVIELLAFGGIICVILYMLIADISLLTALPVLSVYAVATYKLLPAMSQASSSAALLSHSVPAIDAVHEDMVDDYDFLQPAERCAEATPLPFERGLYLDRISFQYASSGVPILHEIRLEIPRSSRCGFVGATGCGKSTLIDVLVGLLRPSSGEFRVDSTPITSDNVHGWQKQLAYVPQDIFLFDDTVAANIALGIPNEQIDQALLHKASTLAQLDGFVRSEMKDGYDTIVGERGVRLSGGERQRIGLARAFYRQPEVLFLDEATSALDSITEEAVVSGIKEQMPSVTVVMVAHRLSTIRFCDTVVLMDDGRLVDQGTYEGLMNSSAQFRNMVEVTG